jgi:hypothetical protein
MLGSGAPLAREGFQASHGPMAGPVLEAQVMSQAHYTPAGTRPASYFSTAVDQPAYQAYVILYLGFIALPILAGADKFAHVLVEWEDYLAPIVPQTLNVTPHHFMLAVGVIEIVAGVLVAVRPQIGAYVVMLWLWGIIVNLLLIQGFYDVALRDFGLSLAALALARLSHEFGEIIGRRS